MLLLVVLVSKPVGDIHWCAAIGHAHSDQPAECLPIRKAANSLDYENQVKPTWKKQLLKAVLKDAALRTERTSKILKYLTCN